MPYVEHKLSMSYYLNHHERLAQSHDVVPKRIWVSGINRWLYRWLISWVWSLVRTTSYFPNMLEALFRFTVLPSIVTPKTIEIINHYLIRMLDSTFINHHRLPNRFMCFLSDSTITHFKELECFFSWCNSPNILALVESASKIYPLFSLNCHESMANESCHEYWWFMMDLPIKTCDSP